MLTNARQTFDFEHGSLPLVEAIMEASR